MKPHELLPPNTRVVLVEGPPGSGKTAFGVELVKGEGGLVVYDPREIYRKKCEVECYPYGKSRELEEKRNRTLLAGKTVVFDGCRPPKWVFKTGTGRIVCISPKRLSIKPDCVVFLQKVQEKEFSYHAATLRTPRCAERTFIYSLANGFEAVETVPLKRIDKLVRGILETLAVGGANQTTLILDTTIPRRLEFSILFSIISAWLRQGRKLFAIPGPYHPAKILKKPALLQKVLGSFLVARLSLSPEARKPPLIDIPPLLLEAITTIRRAVQSLGNPLAVVDLRGIEIFFEHSDAKKMALWIHQEFMEKELPVVFLVDSESKLRRFMEILANNVFRFTYRHGTLLMRNLRARPETYAVLFEEKEKKYAFKRVLV